MVGMKLGAGMNPPGAGATTPPLGGIGVAPTVGVAEGVNVVGLGVNVGLITGGV